MSKHFTLQGFEQKLMTVVDVRDPNNINNASSFYIGQELKNLLHNQDILDIVVPPEAGYLVALMPDNSYAIVELEGELLKNRFSSVDEACAHINHLIMESE